MRMYASWIDIRFKLWEHQALISEFHFVTIFLSFFCRKPQHHFHPEPISTFRPHSHSVTIHAHIRFAHALLLYIPFSLPSCLLSFFLFLHIFSLFFSSTIGIFIVPKVPTIYTMKRWISSSIYRILHWRTKQNIYWRKKLK